MIGVLERRVGGVLGRVCGKVRLSRLSEELLLGGPLMLMALAPRAWKNVMALGHGEQVCAIISKARWLLLSTCQGSMIIPQITKKPDLKGQSLQCVQIHIHSFLSLLRVMSQLKSSLSILYPLQCALVFSVLWYSSEDILGL